MKFSIPLSSAMAMAMAMAMATLGISAATPEANPSRVCGRLGVTMDVIETKNMTREELSNLRMCAEHPLGNIRPTEGESLAPMPDQPIPKPELSVRKADKCEWTAPYGCSGYYCWKSCGAPGDGQWCWTANNGGKGAWNKCVTYADCGTDDVTFGCGVNCWNGGSCGCSC
ncbi:hypothetical protein VHEMI03225 [[Torrubiella] hemipterigena]|uniref:IDI-2 n=1 Tax=[Torrubiella] hemipterigena TaxID=1531966 RepID=A0A0A1TAL6_9HYPO|nr:hypothetical protein VHEMI03225 [[Torrubiella] hemipterigena]